MISLSSPLALNIHNFIDSNDEYSGGSITIGTDGNVYVTTGEKQTPLRVQNESYYAGSIIRVTQNGGVPSDNWGNQAPGRKPEAWARGLRNGFRSTWDYQTNKFYIFEVGGNNHDASKVQDNTYKHKHFSQTRNHELERMFEMYIHDG